MLETAVPVFAEALTTALVVLFLQMAFKVQRPLDRNPRSFEELHHDYYTCYLSHLLMYGVLAVLSMPVWYYGLFWISQWRGSLIGHARFLVLPSHIFWMADLEHP